MEVFLFKSKPVMNICHPSIHTPVLCFIFHVYRHHIKAEYAQGWGVFFSFIIALVLSHRFYNWNSMRSDCLVQEPVSRYSGEYHCVWEPMLWLRRITSECNVSHTRLHGKDLARHVWNGTIPREPHLQRGVYYWLFLRGTKIPCLCASPLPYSRQNVLVFN